MEAAVIRWQCSPALHGYRRGHVMAARRAAAARFGPRRCRDTRPHRRASVELNAFLDPPLVEGSPAATGDVSSLIPVSVLMLLLYFVSNWVVPEMIMKNLQQKSEKETPAAAASSPTPTTAMQQEQADVIDSQIDNAGSKLQIKVKRKRSRRATKI